MKYFDQKSGKFIIVDEAELNKIKNQKLKELEDKTEERLARKEIFQNDESQARLDKRNKVEFMKASSNNQNLESRQKNQSPSVWSYEPDYYDWGKTNPKYSIAGKLGSFFTNKSSYEDSNRLLAFEQSIKLLANSITNSNPSPKFETVKESSPKFSFPKSQIRFESKNDVNNHTGPGSFYHQEFITINRNKNKIL